MLFKEYMKPREDWIRIGKGRHRTVWLLPSGYIVKIPHGDCGGGDANREEAKLWQLRNHENKKRENWKFARCRLIPGTEILVMEFVWPCLWGSWNNIQRVNETIPKWPSWTTRFFKVNSGDLPKWCSAVDLMQVGFNRKGDLVAYDFAW